MTKNPKTKQRAKPSKLKVTLSIVILVVVIITLVSLVVGLVKYSNSKSAVREARSLNEPKYDDDRARRITALLSTGVISDDEPQHSSKVDACYVTHSDSGWFASNYYQDCYIRYVDMFTTSLSRQQIEEKLDSNPDIEKLFGNSFTSLIKGKCDAFYQDSYKDTLFYLTFHNEPGVRSDSDCKTPDQLQGLFTVKGPIVYDKELTTRIERSFKESRVSRSSQYIVMQSDNYYYHESLGCNGVVFCSSPREKPVTGF